MDETLIFQLKKFGMSEYEAKVYAVLFNLRVANAREIHEISNVPRGKVYETLSSLIEKGFVGSVGGTPARYHVTDVTQTFENIRKSAIESINELNDYLLNLETDKQNRLMQAYVLQTTWAVESHILTLFRRSKTEMVILCADENFLKKYSGELEKLYKKIPLYIVLENEGMADFINIPCYLGGKDIVQGLFHPEIAKDIDETKLINIFSDRKDSLAVRSDDDSLEGFFMANDIHAEYFCRTILKNIKLV